MDACVHEIGNIYFDNQLLSAAYSRLCCLALFYAQHVITATPIFRM